MGFFFPPLTLMLHCVSHRPLFKKQASWMNLIIPVGLAPFFGQTPWTYGAHHIGMHHPENNLWKDRSSTLPYQRDSFFDFMRYVTRFFVIGLPELSAYLWKNRRRKLVRRAVAGELIFWIGAVLLFRVNPGATLTVFVAPVIIARFGMMAGNWGQHAFVDATSPGNAYRNSITCIGIGYNDRCFNDGYHIGHHLQARMHWTDLPKEYEANRQRYVEEEAIVIRGFDFFVVWALLMVHAHKRLAKNIVSMPDKTVDERVALMRTRLSPVPEPETAPATNALLA
jgi:fatty acid desaturase